jgi:hypothetical protein
METILPFPPYDLMACTKTALSIPLPWEGNSMLACVCVYIYIYIYTHTYICVCGCICYIRRKQRIDILFIVSFPVCYMMRCWIESFSYLYLQNLVLLYYYLCEHNKNNDNVHTTSASSVTQECKCNKKQTIQTFKITWRWPRSTRSKHVIVLETIFPCNYHVYINDALKHFRRNKPDISITFLIGRLLEDRTRKLCVLKI